MERKKRITTTKKTRKSPSPPPIAEPKTKPPVPVATISLNLDLPRKPQKAAVTPVRQETLPSSARKMLKIDMLSRGISPSLHKKEVLISCGKPASAKAGGFNPYQSARKP